LILERRGHLWLSIYEALGCVGFPREARGQAANTTRCLEEIPWFKAGLSVKTGPLKIVVVAWAW
jgi:hypothetical protein